MNKRKYRLVDTYDGDYVVLGEFTSHTAIRRACHERVNHTGGRCCLSVYKQDKHYGWVPMTDFTLNCGGGQVEAY